MTELTGPGVSGECEYRCGLHFAEDHFLPEIIDQETMEQKRPGRSRASWWSPPCPSEGMPVLRYRTKDITRITYEPCACGRTHARMEKVMGRTDDMLIIKGVNVFPSQIESALVGMEDVGPHYQLVVRRREFPGYAGGEGGADRREPAGQLRRAGDPQRKIHDRLQERAGPGDKGHAGGAQEPGAFPGQGQADARSAEEPEENKRQALIDYKKESAPARALRPKNKAESCTVRRGGIRMKELLLGNEAVARGLYEAGVRVVSSYPGTPSTEITEAAAKYDEIYCEWAPNEKVAMEVAVGASFGGRAQLLRHEACRPERGGGPALYDVLYRR